MALGKIAFRNFLINYGTRIIEFGLTFAINIIVILKKLGFCQKPGLMRKFFVQIVVQILKTMRIINQWQIFIAQSVMKNMN